MAGQQKGVPAQAVVPVYRTLDGVPGKYFDCAHYGLLSAQACGCNYQSAPASAKLGRLTRCLDCPTGAKHAGKSCRRRSSAPAHRSAQVAAAGACVRCRRDGRSAGSRMVGHFRLVRGATLCVSCFNRELEILRGRNAKGAPPKKWRNLFVPRAAYIDRRREVVVCRQKPVIDRIELALTLVREGHREGIAWARPLAPGLPLSPAQGV
jgi:hypothetical protein